MSVIQNFLDGCPNRINVGLVDYEMVTPWVEATFNNYSFGSPTDGANIGATQTITVGNQSSSPDNFSAIKSFEYGVTNGMIVKLEIIDQKGGQFYNFANNLFKDISSSSPPNQSVYIDVKFGWIGLDCFGNSVKIPETPLTVTCFPTNIETSIDSGIIKFMLTCVDPVEISNSNVLNKPFGSSDAKITLKEAIINLCREEPMPFNVRFLRHNSTGGVDTDPDKEWKFQNDTPAVWQASGLRKLEIINEWIQNKTTERGLGVIATWNNQDGGHLILWEDPWGNNVSSCNRNIGTFIVNGGNQSNVISFNPKYNWVQSLANRTSTGGTGPNAVGPAENKTLDKASGLSETITGTDTAQNIHGIHSNEQQNIAQKAHAQANEFAIMPIEGELVVQGLPQEIYTFPIFLIGRFVTIIVINPFYLGTGQVDAVCGNWLNGPEINPILSNKNWMIKGVNHIIREGSFTTTFQVALREGAVTLNIPDL